MKTQRNSPCPCNSGKKHKRCPQWRTEGDLSYIVPFVSDGLVYPSGEKWKAVLLELTDEYCMGMQGMSRKVGHFGSREKAMKSLESHIRQIHPEVTEILPVTPSP